MSKNRKLVVYTGPQGKDEIDKAIVESTKKYFDNIVLSPVDTSRVIMPPTSGYFTPSGYSLWDLDIIPTPESVLPPKGRILIGEDRFKCKTFIHNDNYYCIYKERKLNDIYIYSTEGEELYLYISKSSYINHEGLRVHKLKKTKFHKSLIEKKDNKMKAPEGPWVAKQKKYRK